MCPRGIHLYLQSSDHSGRMLIQGLIRGPVMCVQLNFTHVFNNMPFLFQSGLQHRRKREDMTLLRTLTCCLSAAFAQQLSESVSVGGET